MPPEAPVPVWVMMVTSAVNRGWSGDVIVSDLHLAGPPAASVVRSAKIATIEERDAVRSGQPPSDDRTRVTEVLAPASRWSHPAESIGRRVVGFDLGREPVLDDTTMCNLRHVLERRDLRKRLFETVHEHPERCRIKLARATIVDATLISAQSSTRNATSTRDPEMHRTRTKSRVRARVKRPFLVIAWLFGFSRVRDRGLDNNTHRLCVMCRTANLFMLHHR